MFILVIPKHSIRVWGFDSNLHCTESFHVHQGFLWVLQFPSPAQRHVLTLTLGKSPSTQTCLFTYNGHFFMDMSFHTVQRRVQNQTFKLS